MEKTPARSAILGLGISGEAAAELLRKSGGRVTVLDDRDDPVLRNRAAVLSRRGIEVRLGGGGLPEQLDLVVVSPGVPGNHPLVIAALERGVPVRGEVETAAARISLPLIAVTGTNGKTTTVEVLSRMLAASGRRAVPAGNFGFPLSRAALDQGGADELVVELSSFQIERLERFRCDVAVFLNYAPDHLDRHPDPEVYFRAKARLLSHLAPAGTAVIPFFLRRQLAGFIPPSARTVTWGGEKADIIVREDGIWSALASPPSMVIPLESVSLPGKHNLFNLAAAVGAALVRGAVPTALAGAVSGFTGIPHRLEVVGETPDGVVVVNDSKATNPHAAAAALRSHPGPLIWIAGGSEKGADFSLLRQAVGRVKLAIFIGETAPRLEAALGDLIATATAASLERALEVALAASGPGKAVLLSPACASFDMFANYQDRGERFRALAAGLIRNCSPGGKKKEKGK